MSTRKSFSLLLRRGLLLRVDVCETIVLIMMMALQPINASSKTERFHLDAWSMPLVCRREQSQECNEKS